MKLQVVIAALVLIFILMLSVKSNWIVEDESICLYKGRDTRL